jgi:Zn-dependent protease with chaperone function
MLGGRIVDSGTTDLAERRLLNVVEEMALAAGTSVPPVYVLDHERSINAFAAGHDPQSAVVAVSRGALTYLTRDELQGVMGHEFSHILNGDMRLNLRLIGVLHGILLLAIIGYYVLRIAPSGRSDKKGGGGAILLIGLGLLVVGFVGLFFAKLIRSSVSRQREYLADASAVQFTRYPAGIGGALKKIGGLVEGSRVRDAHADEVSHMFFGDAFAGSLMNLFATHPPLAERVRRIDPAFDGTFPETVPLVEEDESRAAGREPSRLRPAAAAAVAGLAGTAAETATSGAAVVNRIGTLTPEHLTRAAALIEQTPPRLAQAASEPFGARAVVYAVLLNREEDVRQRQLAVLQSHVDEPCYREMAAIVPLVDRLSEEARLPLVDRASPALKQLSPRQYAAFREIVEVLVKADGKISLLEYTIQSMLFRTLDVHFGLTKPPRIQYYGLGGVLEPVRTVLSTLAYAGQTRDEEARRAFELGMKEIGRDAALLAKDQCALDRFDAALLELAKVAPKVKRPIVAACAACVAADGTVTLREAELLRAVTSTLGCPMPPL